MHKNILTENISNMISQMKFYINNEGTRKVKVEKLLNDIINLSELYNKKISIVFIADKGIGKTSIINYILNLIYKREKIKRGSKDKKIDIYQDVLDTGAGATTSFEVEILQSENDINKIEIEPYTKEETLIMVREFCKKTYADVFNDKKLIGNLPPEILRALRNMTGLKITELQDKTKIDLAKELVLEYEGRYDEFEELVIKRCNLELRNETCFTCDVFDEKSSIRSTFRKINLMHIEKAPLPRKIILKISNQLFDFTELGNIHSLIDTRGLESGVIPTDRKDIRRYFKNEQDKIIILVDKFNSPSQSIVKLLDNYIHDSECEVVSRLAYVSNFKDGEPENVLMEDGEADIEAEGIQYKNQQLIDYMKSNNINVDINNILFTNPKRFMDSEGAIKIEIDDIDDYGSKVEAIKAKMEIRDIKRKELIEAIKTIEENRRKFILNQMGLKFQEFIAIKNKELEGLDINKDLIIKQISELKKNINHETNEKIGNSILSEYIQSNHPSTLMAMNNRYGIYYEKDIYLVGCNEIEQIFKIPFAEICNNVIKHIKNNVKTEQEKKAISFVIQSIKEYFYNCIEDLNSNFYLYLKEDIFNKEYDRFWNTVVRRWGMGQGYVNDIVGYYENQLLEKEFGKLITNILSKEMDNFKEGLIKLINEDI